MQSALKFLFTGMALVVVVGVGAIAYSLLESGKGTKDLAAVQPQADSQAPAAESPSGKCPRPDPARGYVSGNVIFRLSNDVFPPSATLAKEIHDRYGTNVNLADWDNLKAILLNEADVRKFIQDTGIRLQSANYDCDNILVSRSGGETVQGLHYHLARHDGKVPPNWSVLDTIGSNDIHLGRWSHSGQALLTVPQGQ